MLSEKNYRFQMQKIRNKILEVIFQSDESYKNLLDLKNIVFFHQRHLRFLVTKTFKSVSKRNPKFIWSYFSYKNLLYNIKRGSSLSVPSTNSTVYEVNPLLFRGKVTWNNLLCFIKSSATVFVFKRNPKIQGGIDCTWVICKKQLFPCCKNVSSCNFVIVSFC